MASDPRNKTSARAGEREGGARHESRKQSLVGKKKSTSGAYSSEKENSVPGGLLSRSAPANGGGNAWARTKGGTERRKEKRNCISIREWGIGFLKKKMPSILGEGRKLMKSSDVKGTSFAKKGT